MDTLVKEILGKVCENRKIYENGEYAVYNVPQKLDSMLT